MTTKKHKNILDKYKQPIFSTEDLYISKDSSFEYLQKEFDLPDGDRDYIEDYPAVTIYGVSRKNSNLKCVLIHFNTKIIKSNSKSSKDKYFLDGTLSHEALHAAYYILSQCGIDLTSSTDEVYAYTVGWITACARKTYDKK